MREGILDDVTLDVDGVTMQASIEALRLVPALPRIVKRWDGCWYDDGPTREWISPDSQVTIVIDEGTALPKIPTLTDWMADDALQHVKGCRAHGTNAVFALTPEGSIEFLEDAD